MAGSELPQGRAKQRAIERAWQGMVKGRRAASTDVAAPIRSSWERSLDAKVRPDLPCAPLPLDESSLAAARQESAWLGLAQEVLGHQVGTVRESRHVLTLFDAEGRMLASDGDPATLERLREIHFMPGALWSEAAVGTNGPGMALALGAPVHVVGAEHFCASWQAWHCAALPVRDPTSGAILGALDLSGAREHASPFALGFATALAHSVELALHARQSAHTGRVLALYAELAGRYPTDSLIALDAASHVLAASPSLHDRAGVGTHLAGVEDELLADAPAWLQGARVFSLKEGQTRLGACVLVPGRQREGERRVVARPELGTVAPAAAPASARTSRVRYGLEDLVGAEGGLRKVAHLTHVAARNTLPVFVLGESGVGKEVVAQSIHGGSARARAPFVAVNCAAVARELFESELFGYAGGSFTGARREGHPGKFELADGGTLFLDEIAELPVSAQAALLRVLQEGEVTPVGASHPRRVDVRIIAATNRDVVAELAAGRLRSDLYHRLNVIVIELPPLRDRREDIPVLTARLLELAAVETGRAIRVSPEAAAAFSAYDWPGNVRELKNLLRRLCATCESDVAQLEDLPAPIRDARRSPLAFAAATGDALHARLVAVINATKTMAEAARQLGVDRSTLYRQLERYGLRPKRTVEER